MGDKWGWKVSKDKKHAGFTVRYVRGDADALQQSLRLPPLPLQVRVFVAGRRTAARLTPALRVSLQSTGQNKNKAAAWQDLQPYMTLQAFNLHPSSSSPLLFSSSPLEFERSAVSSSPAQPSAHSCQTYCRRTMKRFFKKCFTACFCFSPLKV